MTRDRAAAEPQEYYALVQEIGQTEHTIALIRTRRSAPDEIWLRCGVAGGWHPMRTKVPDFAAPLLLRPWRAGPGHEAEGSVFLDKCADPSVPVPTSSLSIAGRLRRARKARRPASNADTRYEQLEIAISTEQPPRPPSPIPPPAPTLHPPGESLRRWFSLR